MKRGSGLCKWGRGRQASYEPCCRPPREYKTNFGAIRVARNVTGVTDRPTAIVAGEHHPRALN